MNNKELTIQNTLNQYRNDPHYDVYLKLSKVAPNLFYNRRRQLKRFINKYKNRSHTMINKIFGILYALTHTKSYDWLFQRVKERYDKYSKIRYFIIENRGKEDVISYSVCYIEEGVVMYLFDHLDLLDQIERNINKKIKARREAKIKFEKLNSTALAKYNKRKEELEKLEQEALEEYNLAKEKETNTVLEEFKIKKL